MKKQNNRYRNGNNNNGYTLNYKFDSVSIAGKVSGTALDLIRKYNDLAKEAQSCGDYVEMEIYRQYAEHYRKIVTDINERRQTRQENNNRHNEQEEQIVETQVENKSDVEMTSEPVEPEAAPNGYVETLPATENIKKAFEIVEVTEEKAESDENVKPKRVYRRRTPVKKAEGD
ncbi:MAG: DUF4167 domain-containing protein [Alphaproteobacteria bacterium]|nr:DUF4167 domain-containing protein [Alphaproteobacteria bacterium]